MKYAKVFRKKIIICFLIIISFTFNSSKISIKNINNTKINNFESEKETMNEIESEFEIIEYTIKKGISITDKDYIKKLETNKIYIQVGAFSLLKNAESLFEKISENEYIKKIYRDKDGLYKILIVTNKFDNDIFKKISNTITGKAFIKVH